MLQDADKAVENMQKHKVIELGIMLFLLFLFLFDLVCLSVDQTVKFKGYKFLSLTALCMLCIAQTIMLFFYIYGLSK